MEKKQHITVHIGDTLPIGMDIERKEEEKVRFVANKVNMMWAQWIKKYPNTSSKDILAMLALRYAQVYYDLVDQINANETALVEAEEALDNILLDVK